MSVTFENRDGILVARLNGDLDANNSPAVESAIDDQIEKGQIKIVLDFSNSEYISSAGLRVILKATKILKEKAGNVVLCHANEQITEVLQISGFMALVICMPTLEDAIERLS